MDVKKEADKVLKALSESLGEINLEETYYVVDDINVTRKDGARSASEDFRKIVKKNAHKIDDDGNFLMEVGKWVE